MADIPPPDDQSASPAPTTEGAPTYGGPPQRQPSNGMGVAALVVGILALVLSILFFPLGLVLGIVAVVLGIVGMRKANRGEATNKGQATAGLVTGAIAVVIAGLLVAFVGRMLVENREEFTDLAECMEQAETDAERDDCQAQFQEDLGR